MHPGRDVKKSKQKAQLVGALGQPSSKTRAVVPMLICLPRTEVQSGSEHCLGSILRNVGSGESRQGQERFKEGEEGRGCVNADRC